jgi:hypothetical protein
MTHWFCNSHDVSHFAAFFCNNIFVDTFSEINRLFVYGEKKGNK